MGDDARFVVIYRWRIAPGRRAEFERAWERVTRAIRDGCGSGGSALFRDDDGVYTAIARWPSEDARARCAAGAPEDFAIMRECTVERLPELRLHAVADLWTSDRYGSG